MSFVRILIHIVFSTHNREPHLTENIRESLISHIINNSKSGNIYLECVNGWIDHLHILISLGKDQNISKITQLLKGESSHWLNQLYFKGRFKWQDDYYAVSIGESAIGSLKKYILNQKEHHRVKTFAEEVEELLKKYNFRNNSEI
jgi:putative transposase